MASCKLISHSGTGRYLNIEDSYTIANGTNITIYKHTGSMDQKWTIDNPKSQSPQYIKHLTQESFGLNARRSGTNWPCTLYTASGNADGSVVLKETAPNSGLYTITLSNHANMRLTAASNADVAPVTWQIETSNTNQIWKIQILPEPTSVTSGAHITTGTNGWLRLYKQPTDNKVSRTIAMPSVAQFTGPNNYIYRFTNKNNWYTNEKFANTNVRGLTGKPAKINPGLEGCRQDEYGNYWIAVGPKVTNPSHADGTKVTPSEMYGRGKFDVVVKNAAGTKFYIPGVAADVKNHTYNNGIIQTWKPYPSGTPVYNCGQDFNGVVCCEFIGDLAAKFSGLSGYTIDSIIFYGY